MPYVVQHSQLPIPQPGRWVNAKGVRRRRGPHFLAWPDTASVRTSASGPRNFSP